MPLWGPVRFNMELLIVQVMTAACSLWRTLLPQLVCASSLCFALC